MAGSKRRASPIPPTVSGCALSHICYEVSGLQYTHSSAGSWSFTASSCIISPLLPYYTSPVMLPFVSCFWATRLILSCGRGYSALCPVHRRGHYIKWAEPKYGASPGPDTCPVPRRIRPKTGLRSGFTWRTSPFQTLFGGVFLSSTTLL